MTPADEHRAIAATFTDRVHGVTDWDAPAPCDGWLARDVVRHLVTWLPGLLASGSDVTLPPVDDDPAAAWAAHSAAVQAVLDDPASQDKILRNPHIGEIPVDQAISRFYTSDVFLHTWDLARASGQDDRLDPERCQHMYDGMLPMDEVLRGSGHYGPRVHVAEDADPQTKLLAFIGRDPAWHPLR